MNRSIQFFVYNVPEIASYPILRFASEEELHTFVNQLVSTGDRQTSDGYMVINNPQLLPNHIREPHRYECPVLGYPSIGIFTIKDNIQLLRSYANHIDDNNSNSNGTGFSEYIMQA